MKKKILFFLLIFGLGLVHLLAINNPVRAQGNCECHYVGSDCVPDPDADNCDYGLDPMCGAICSCSCGIPPTPTSPPSNGENGNGGGGPIETALGPIDVSSPEGFVNTILKLAIGIGGGIAILLIIYGAFLYLTSAGNPEKVQAGKELISSAIVGLLVIIFAVFIMEMIGVKILKIF